jgi:hypothetical protein
MTAPERFHYPRDLDAAIAQLERSAGTGAASFADLQRLANLRDRRIRQIERRAMP